MEYYLRVHLDQLPQRVKRILYALLQILIITVSYDRLLGLKYMEKFSFIQILWL
jgi:hypothetical protein